MRRIALLLTAFFLALIISGCGSPDQSVKMFLKYRIKNDTRAAKLYCTDQVDQKIDTGEFSLEALGFVNPFGSALSWDSEKEKMNLQTLSKTDTEAEIAKGSGPSKVTFHLVREGGMWKISGIEPAEPQPIPAEPPAAGAKPGEAAPGGPPAPGADKAAGAADKPKEATPGNAGK